MQAAINAARGYLPPNLPSNPTYRKVNPADAPILIFALTSDTHEHGRAVRRSRRRILQQQLSRVEGVGQVFVGGSSLPAVRVELNPQALSRYGARPRGRARACSPRTNVRRPKGQLADGDTDLGDRDQRSAAPAPTQYRPLDRRLRERRARSASSDVADVEDSVEDLRTAGLANGKPAVLRGPLPQPGREHHRDRRPRARGCCRSSRPRCRRRSQLSVVLDRTPPIRASLHDVELTLLVVGRSW